MAPVIKCVASAYLAPSFCGLVNPQFSSGLVNPQVPATCVEVSAPESTPSVEGIDPAPHIHEQFTIQKWLRMATTLRTPLRITTSRLSTMR